MKVTITKVRGGDLKKCFDDMKKRRRTQNRVSGQLHQILLGAASDGLRDVPFESPSGRLEQALTIEGGAEHFFSMRGDVLEFGTQGIPYAAAAQARRVGGGDPSLTPFANTPAEQRFAKTLMRYWVRGEGSAI